MTVRRALTLVAIASAAACVDSNSGKSDSASALPNAGAGQRVDMIRLDTTSRVTPSTIPAVSSPAAPQAQPPHVIGEGRRTNEPPLNSSAGQSRDPMPPLTGETSKRGGTMPVAPPILRDSTSGPRMEIDSKGKVVPIKR